jgi:DNA-binding transcriptional ArsR family regulator
MQQEAENRTLEKARWYWIEKSILERYGREIKSTGLAVYNALAFFADSQGFCFPTQRSIAKIVGLSRRTVARKLKLLSELGLIEMEKKRGRFFYRLLKPKDKVKT